MNRFDFVWFNGKKYKVKPYGPSKKEKQVIPNGTYRTLAEYQHEYYLRVTKPKRKGENNAIN